MRWLLAAGIAGTVACAAHGVPQTPPPGHPSPALWVRSNTGASDLTRLLTDCVAWPVTCARTTAVGVHWANVTDDCLGRPCTGNTWATVGPPLAAARVRGVGVDLAHEALKEWDCDGTSELATLRALIARAGGLLTSVSMDWPFAGAHACGLNHAAAARLIARYTQVARDAGLAVILTEGWPTFTPDHFFSHLDALGAAGAAIRAVHLDLDLPSARGRPYGPDEVRLLVAGIRARGLVAGLIVTGWEGRSTAAWGQTAREFARTVLQGWLGCDVDRVIVESWARVGTDAREWLRLWPLNLPETNPDSLTGLARTETCG